MSNMYVKISIAYGEVWEGLTFGTLYAVLGEKDGCLLIKDDFDNPIYIYECGCM